MHNDMRGQERIPSKGISITELCIPIINSWIHIIHDNIEYPQFSYGYKYMDIHFSDVPL